MIDSTANIKLRTATVDDLPFINLIEQQSFVVGIQEKSETFANRLKTFNDGFLVAVTDTNQIVGYICCEIWSATSIIGDQFYHIDHDIRQTHNKLGSILYISSMGVLPLYRNKMLGRKLLVALEANIRNKYNITTSVLIVGSVWEKAIQLYRNCGFDQLRMLSNFFKPIDYPAFDGILMFKHLD